MAMNNCVKHACAHSGGHGLFIAPLSSLNGNATVEKLAANAVMAGCLPAYFPLVLTAVRAMLRPGYNLNGVQTTTGNVAPLAIVNGPCRENLAINYAPTRSVKAGAPTAPSAERFD